MTSEHNKSCCFTGHRKIDQTKISDIVSKLNLEIEYLTGLGVTRFIAGGALGFDTLAALAILWHKQNGSDISLHLMIPCADQCRRWSDRDICVYRDILSRADSYDILSDHYHGGVMQIRNRAMGDASDYCICYWDKSTMVDGKPGGGTYYTVNYARKQGKKIINLCDEPPEELQLTFDFTE